MSELPPGADRPPMLETERLVLRPLEPSDAEAVFAIFSDPESMRYWDTPPQTDLDEARRLIERSGRRFAERSLLQWGLERRRDGELLGVVSLMPAPASQPRAAIGYIVGRAHWRQGYGGEAQRRVIEFAFVDLGLRRLEADVHPANEASLRSLERLGFVREGLLRERWVVDGEPSDSVILGLLASDFA